jgi:hypothetical protein
VTDNFVKVTVEEHGEYELESSEYSKVAVLELEEKEKVAEVEVVCVGGARMILVEGGYEIEEEDFVSVSVLVLVLVLVSVSVFVFELF